MKKVRLLLGASALLLASTCFGLTKEANLTFTKTNAIVNPGGPNTGQGLVIDVQPDGTITLVDMTTGAIRIISSTGLTVGISMGDTVTFIFVTTPNGNEVIRQIKRVN